MISGKGGYAADLFFALKRKKAFAVKAFFGKIYGYRLSLSLIKTAAGKNTGCSPIERVVNRSLFWIRFFR